MGGPEGVIIATQAVQPYGIGVILSLFYHPVRLERTYSVFLIQVRETQVFVCARATLDWWIALDLKRVVGF